MFVCPNPIIYSYFLLLLLLFVLNYITMLILQMYHLGLNLLQKFQYHFDSNKLNSLLVLYGK